MSDYKERLHKSTLTRYRKQCASLMKGKLLDVGGGLGMYVPYFGTKNVTILDMDEETLSRINGVNTILGDVEQMPFDDEMFDSVWSCAVGQYVDFNKMVKECLRVCKVGGRIMILVPNGKSPWDKVKRFFKMDTWSDLEGLKRLQTVDDLLQYGKVVGEVVVLPFFVVYKESSIWSHINVGYNKGLEVYV